MVGWLDRLDTFALQYPSLPTAQATVRSILFSLSVSRPTCAFPLALLHVCTGRSLYRYNGT